MRDHRQWTSVRDNHIENMEKAQTKSIINNEIRFNSLQNENCVVTDDIVSFDADQENLDDTDIIEEAEKLLDQLDLLSSSDS